MASTPDSSIDPGLLPRDMVSSFRKSAPKSHGGCITCKIRRVKCDEQKPFCGRCISTSRKCDGYALGVPAAKKQKRKSGRPQKSPSPSEVAPGPLVIYTPSVGIEGSSAERRSFHYFNNRIKPSDMPGNFEPYFWNNIVLKFSHIHPTVKHSLIALSAIYEERDQREKFGLKGSPLANEYVLLQYTKAVKDLVNYLSLKNQDPRIALMACLMFVWIEFFQDNLEPGFGHLEGGLKILGQLKSSGQLDPSSSNLSDTEDIYGSLERSFKRLRIQAAIHGSPSNEFTTSSTRNIETIPAIPEIFANMSESRLCFDNECNTVFASLRELRESELNAIGLAQPGADHVPQTHLRRFEQWHVATERMIAESNHLQGNLEALEVNWLRVYYLVITLSLKTMLRETEMFFDDYTTEFEQIIGFCERLLLEPKAKTRPLLCFDMGILPPLFFVALKCRVLRIRRKALALLRLAPYQEGMWFRDKFIKVSEWKIGEEESQRGDLPESSPLPQSARIDLERTEVDSSGKTFLTFKRGDNMEAIPLPSDMEGVQGIGNVI